MGWRVRFEMDSGNCPFREKKHKQYITAKDEFVCKETRKDCAREEDCQYRAKEELIHEHIGVWAADY